MRKILIANIFKDQDELDDVIYRLYHHFSFIENIKFYIFRSNFELEPRLSLPEYFGQISFNKLKYNNFFDKIIFKTVKDDEDISDIAKNATHVIVYSEDFYKRNNEVIKINKPKIYWCDRNETRQEGSNYIQAALDLLPVSEKEKNNNDCILKFNILNEKLKDKYKESVLLATGPSIENFMKYKMKDKLGIACNSTILNKDLVNHANIKIIVFADPIFHFGVSRYADEFRNKCKIFLNENKDVFVVIPIKYYALLVSLLPEFFDRIVGIPFTKTKEVNLNITDSSFYTYTTSNILTLLLLPLATTFTKKINLIGCDGRDINDDDYFWGHGSSVQINSQMKNIQECHPGFFKIDYNEYYFQHCHTLDNIINYAEFHGYQFQHWGNTYIPALKYRSLDNQLYSFDECNFDKVNKANKIYIIEPDGLDFDSGHYFHWHINLYEKLIKKNKNVTILSNLLSEYPRNINTKNIFDVNSWELQRSKGSMSMSFPYNNQNKKFFNSICNVIEQSKDEINSMFFFMYYGSVQAVKCFLELQKKYKEIDFNFNVCIFSESVNLSKKSYDSNFHPDTKNILTEAAAKIDNFRVFAVTRELSDLIYNNYEIKLAVMNHPIVRDNSLSLDILKLEKESIRHLRKNIDLCIPTRLSNGKSLPNLSDSLLYALEKTHNLRLKLKKSPEALNLVSRFPKKILNEKVCLIDTKDDIAFVKAMHESDIIFIPYSPQAFWGRTSGILYDSILIGKPVITLNNTWMSRVAKDLRCGIYVSFLNGESILSAISIISNNRHFFESNIDIARNYLKENENFEELVRMLSKYQLNAYEYYGI